MRQVPFFDYPQLWIKEREVLLSIIDNTSSNGSFIMQSELDDFENNLSEYTGSKFSIGVGNATDAMEIYLQAIGIKEGDEIVIHHNVFRRYYDIKGKEKNSSKYFKDNLYFCQPAHSLTGAMEPVASKHGCCDALCVKEWRHTFT